MPASGDDFFCARARRALRVPVVGEVTVVFVLLVSMSLLGRSLFNSLDVNPGFRRLCPMVVSVAARGHPQRR